MTDLNNITVKLNQSNFNIKVQKNGGNIQAIDPITAKNQIQEIHSIDDLGLKLDQRIDGSTVVWNAYTGQYEVKSIFITNSTVGSLSVNNAIYLNNKPDVYFAANSSLQNYYPISNPYQYANLTFGVAGSANNSQYLRGKIESTLNVNSAVFANSSLYLTGKLESDLNVNNAIYANSSLYLGGKAESTLNVNNAIYANSSLYLGGKAESNLSVNFASFSNFATFSNLANNANYINNKIEGNLNVNNAITSNTALYFNGVIDCGVY